MLIVHHLNNSRSQRVLWTLEELKLPYYTVCHQQELGMLAPFIAKESASSENPL